MNAWDVWLHPRYYKRQLNFLQKQIELLEASCDETKRIELELEIQRKTNATAKKTIADSARSIESLTQELLKTRKELDEERAFTKQVEELEKRFNDVINMKTRYEERIKKLKNDLSEAREALRVSSSQDFPQKELTPIDMSQQNLDSIDTLRSKTSSITSHPRNTHTLKTPQTTPSLFKNIQEKAQLKTSDEDSHSDEWLIQLPEE